MNGQGHPSPDACQGVITGVSVSWLDCGLWRQKWLQVFLGCAVSAAPFRLQGENPHTAMVGWGRKPSGRRAQRRAARQNPANPCWLLEDGFLRSFGPGSEFPSLSMVVDDAGIYYDSTTRSALETLIASDVDVMAGIAPEVARAKSLILRHRLSKYNHAPHISASELSTRIAAARPQGTELPYGGVRRVLVVDQTMGDLSVKYGGADAGTFAAMVSAARAENPNAVILLKTHPEVSSGRKRGYLSELQADERTIFLRDAVNPISLIELVDCVYVVTSQMGFEALLAGKPVTVFGMPWYSGWGVTDDRQVCARRLPRAGRSRSVDELFAAAYFHYCRYLDPETHGRGTIFDVIAWLVRQQGEPQCVPELRGSRMIGVGFPRWKASNVKPLLGLREGHVRFASTVRAADALGIRADDKLVFWGCDAPSGLTDLALRTAAQLTRMEDGFVRSVGLGSDLIRPQSLVLDGAGIYFDPRTPSGLEQILNQTTFTSSDLGRAVAVRSFIVQNGITKYNLESIEPVSWPSEGRQVVLVPGQVENDASIRYGCTSVTTNLHLLERARQSAPNAFLVYKPHPDVSSGNRPGRIADAVTRQWADFVETERSIISCIEACDEVHTMTSLAGFDALIRSKRVVVYGQPFYSGWGLTVDVEAIANGRRRRLLTLDELVAGTLLHYPIYWDWDLNGYTTCEAVIHRIAEERNRLNSTRGLEALQWGRLRRAWRKFSALMRGLGG